MSKDGEIIIWLIGGCGCGVWGFFWGFMRLRRKRLIENIPTSNIRSMAMGLVELIGRAFDQQPLTSPLAGAPCVYYHYMIERYQSSGKHSRWVTIGRGNSQYHPFLLVDETGQVTVDPKAAEIIVPCSYRFETGVGRTVPSRLIALMNTRRIAYQGIFGMSRLRFREWIIAQDQETYVLGCAKKNDDFLSTHKQALIARLNQIKKDPVAMAQIDTDKDGKVSLEEWDIAVAAIETALIEQEMQSAQAVHDTVVIGCGDTERVFIISNQSQKTLISQLYWQSVAGVFGGIMVVAGCLWGVLEYFKN